MAVRERRAFVRNCLSYAPDTAQPSLPNPSPTPKPDVDEPNDQSPAPSPTPSPTPTIPGNPELVFFVSPSGKGDQTGIAEGHAMSLAAALTLSASSRDTELLFVLLDGEYEGFVDESERSVPHYFWSQNSHGAHFTEPVSLHGENFHLSRFSLDVYRGAVRDEFGVSLRGSGNAIKDCVVVGEGRYAAQHPRSVGVKLSGSHNTIAQCDISEANYAIGGGGTHQLISHNNLHTTTAAPIRVAGVSHSIIENNLVHNSSRCTPMQLWCGNPEEYPMPEWDVSRYLNSCNIPSCPNGGLTGYSSNGPHPNLISARALDHVTIRGNKGWNGQIPTLRIRDGFGGEGNGTNIIVENNIFPQFFGYTGELTVRNNIFGTAQFGTISGTQSECRVKDFTLNIVGSFNYSNSGTAPCTTFENRGYNLIQWAGCRAGYDCQVHPTDLVLSGRWSDFSHWSDIFVDYQGINNLSDFRLRPGSLAIDFGPIDRSAATDRHGQERVEIHGQGGEFPYIADAGVYEYSP